MRNEFIWPITEKSSSLLKAIMSIRDAQNGGISRLLEQ